MEVDSKSILSAVRRAIGDSADEKPLSMSEMGYEVIVNIGFPDNKKMIKLFKKLESAREELGVSFDSGGSQQTCEPFIDFGWGSV